MKRVLCGVSAVLVLVVAACAQAGKTDNLFALETKPTAAKAGEKASAEIQIKVKGGGYVSHDAPLKVSLTGKNVTLAKDKLAKADAAYQNGGVNLPVPFTAGAQGEGAIEANLTFFMCSKEICERHERKVTLPVTVQ